MPYIAIKSFPKDEETKKELVQKVNDVFLEVLGCPKEAVTISFEEFLPEEWEKKVVNTEIKPNEDKMMIISGEKKF